MGIVGGSLGYHLLRASQYAVESYYGGESKLMNGSAYQGKSKLEILLGPDIWEKISGKTVIDFGCGTGSDSIEMAQRGAESVLGVDIVEEHLNRARTQTETLGLTNCRFSNTADDKADVIISVDGFEHYSDPAGTLRKMASLLNPKGRVLAAFGPTWYHPLGGHLFSVFPWSHLLFDEQSLIRWRNDFKDDGATCFSEVRGGLNQMTIARFERILNDSPFEIESFECVPIRRMKPLANRFTRELTTAIVRCALIS